MIAEQLIASLRFQASGVDKVKLAAKELANLKRALNGLAGGLRVNLSGPANLARSLKSYTDAARGARAAQKQLASGSDFGRADAGAQRHISTVKRLAAAYREAATAGRSVGLAGRGPSWAQSELAHLRQYAALQKQIAAQNRGMGVPPSGRNLPAPSSGRHLPAPTRYGSGPVAMPTTATTKNFVERGFDSATSVPQVQQFMRLRQESEPNIKRATDLANQLAGEVKQFTSAQHLQSIYQSLAIMGDMDKALQAAPMLQRANALIEGLQDQYKSLQPFKGGTATKDFSRLFDIFGVTDNPKRMKALAEGSIKGIEQSAGDITPADMVGSAQFARSAKNPSRKGVEWPEVQ